VTWSCYKFASSLVTLFFSFFRFWVLVCITLSVIKNMFLNLIVQDPFVSYHVMLVLFISVGEVKKGGMGCTQSVFSSLGLFCFCKLL
jgi:hypothetical protein